jgi:ribosomal protein L11 methylase PrmA
MMEDLHSIIKINGKLILSGIIIEKAEEVKKSALDAGFNFLEMLTEDNWTAIIVEKISL